MKQALGLVEIQGLSTAVMVADTMVKAANVQILELENTKGLGYMTIKIAGDVGAVDAAVNAGRQVGAAYQKLVSWKVIPRPSDYVEHTFCNPDPPEPDVPLKMNEKDADAGDADDKGNACADPAAEPVMPEERPKPKADQKAAKAAAGSSGTETVQETEKAVEAESDLKPVQKKEKAADQGTAKTTPAPKKTRTSKRKK